MAQDNVSDMKTLVTAEAIDSLLLCRVNSSAQWALNGLGQYPDAVMSDYTASGGQGAATWWNHRGTRRVVASAAITAGALVYAAASGKVSATAVGPVIGRALAAASGDGSVIEVMPWAPTVGDVLSVQAKTADYTVTAAESGGVFTTTGATGTVVFSMPAAVVGLEYYFRVGAGFELRIDPNGTEKVSLTSTGVPGAAGKYLSADTSGESVHLVCTKAGEWTVYGFTGTWTAEA